MFWFLLASRSIHYYIIVMVCTDPPLVSPVNQFSCDCDDDDDDDDDDWITEVIESGILNICGRGR